MKALIISDCYTALRSTVNKGRSIEAELLKSKVSLFTRLWYSPQGHSTEFGVLLSSTHERIPPVLEIEIPELGDELLGIMLSEHLDENNDVQQSSGIYLVVLKDYEDSNAP